jgi:DNA-binding transcriptional ArsR family regulator
MQERLAMVGANKGLLGCEVNGDGTFDMWYNLPDNLYIISNQGFTINEDWLDQLEAWIMARDIKLVILDPLMMMGEDVDEFKAFEVMSQILKPLKRLRARTQAAIVVVHHHTKGAGQGGAKDMYGSVALWAWEEAALHLNVVGMGTVIAERFSKHSLLKPITIEIGEIKEKWAPQITRVGAANLYDALVSMDGGATVEQLVSYTNMGREAVDRQLKQLETDGKVEKSGKRRTGQGRPSVIWRVTA